VPDILPKGRDYVTPQDMKHIGKNVLHHCVVIMAGAMQKISETIIKKIFDELPGP
jgi:hypothetical protein